MPSAGIPADLRGKVDAVEVTGLAWHGLETWYRLLNAGWRLPLTLLAGLYGMNVRLPQFPGGEDAQFWWLCAISLGVIMVMLALFRRMRWI